MLSIDRSRYVIQKGINTRMLERIQVRFVLKYDILYKKQIILEKMYKTLNDLRHLYFMK